MCREPSDHRWSSHIAYLQAKKRPPWLVVEEVLSMFGTRYHEAAKKMDSFVKTGVPPEVSKRLEEKQLPGVLGSDTFKRWVKRNYVEPLRSDKEIPEARRILRHNIPLESIERSVCSYYEVEKITGIKGNQTCANEARAMAIHLMRRVAAASHREIAEAMGGMSTAAVAKSLQRFQRRIAHDDVLREKSESLASQLLSHVQT
jgi:hypothetical protein